MDKFLVKPKIKPCSITPQERANQHPGKFLADDNLLFCLTCNVVVDHHRKSVLDNHLSAVLHIKRNNESCLKQAKQQTLKTSFKCKTPAQEERVKVCHEWITAFGEKYVTSKICKQYEKFKKALVALIHSLIFTSNCLKNPC